jgi:hypothetical protein
MIVFHDKVWRSSKKWNSTWLFIRLYGSIHIHFHIRSEGIYIKFIIRGKIRGIDLFKSLGTSILNKGHRRNFDTYIRNFNTVHPVVRLIDFGTPTLFRKGGGRRMPFSSPRSIRFFVLKSSQKWHSNGWFHDRFWLTFILLTGMIKILPILTRKSRRNFVHWLSNYFHNFSSSEKPNHSGLKPNYNYVIFVLSWKSVFFIRFSTTASNTKDLNWKKFSLFCCDICWNISFVSNLSIRENLSRKSEFLFFYIPEVNYGHT